MTDLAIFGSCVSRDMCRVVPDRFRPSAYVARQSWVSAFSPPTAAPAAPSRLTSPFQQRAVDADLASAAPARLREIAATRAPLLLDLIEERYGALPTATGYVTPSFELIASGWADEIAAGPVIRFGSDPHFILWAVAAHRLRELLEETGLAARTFVARVDYATHAADGAPLGAVRGYAVGRWNEMFARYYAHLEELGFTLLTPAPELAVADPGHAWGLEPVHYLPGYYAALADRLEDALAT